jgi:hypothetical protein
MSSNAVAGGHPNQTLVISETFESEVARDRAIRAYTEAGPGHAPDREQVFYTLGNTFFTVVGPHDDAVFALVDQHLRQLGAE